MGEEAKYNVVLTESELNQVLTALGQGPFVQVYNLITNIREQVTPQLPKPAEE